MEKEREEIRIESDSMGEASIPSEAYWGAQTQRALENFSVSSLLIPKSMIRSLALIKKNAAKANMELDLLDREKGEAIVRAAQEVFEEKWNDHFPVDVFQTGSGTSWNMNMNEVIANRANEILKAPLGNRFPVHPNDHVNKGQSSNDVIPSAIHIANRMLIEELMSRLKIVDDSLKQKEDEFKDILKLGRTHLQDAVPMTLGQEFSGFANQVEKGIARIRGVLPRLEELALGGTAIGTGLNCHPRFADKAIKGIASDTGFPFRPARNLFEAIASRDAQVELMGILNTLAAGFFRIANDLRLLASGPRSGLGEIILPSLQPGSSIMSGKVNPVIPEMVLQAAAFIQGKAVSVTIAGQTGPLELNMMQPLIAYETLTSIKLLSNTAEVFAKRCIKGIRVNRERCQHWIEQSLALVTPLAGEIGYDQAAQLAYKAYQENKTIREVVEESGVLPLERVEDLLNPGNMI